MTDNTPTLTLYNSLTRKKEVFTPQDPTRVTMYNCGPTVYSYAHIGNARAAVVADVLFRVLRHIYGEDHVVYARNITDVDDKIIAAAKDQGVDIKEITEKYARIYNEDLAAIGCLPPTYQPKATDNIGGMIAIIEKLIADDYAYVSDGHVFFDVSKFDDYGKLSGNTLENLRGGDRVGEGEVARKKNAADFVLWKPELDGVGWDAPFGKGRPGWHIECSAMAKETLGETIDIHCGGVDLKFPHHENEIAQSECAHGKTMANYWAHNEFLSLTRPDGYQQKMSKSAGNVTLIHDLLKDWHGEVIRLALLKAHYRSELVWSEDLLRESKEQLDGWYRLIEAADPHPNRVAQIDKNYLNKILDDINTAEGIGFFSKFRQYINFSRQNDYKIKEQYKVEGMTKVTHHEETRAAEFVASANLLGLLQKDPEEWFSGGISDTDHALAAEYDTVRAEAVAAKKFGDKAAMGAAFSRSDAIRDDLKSRGLVLETGADGVSVLRKA
ncbi:cysteine--tRNA ligase [Fretibacter rubidus]|uniref:cysteine--tRNA ligase n=1 Tax=Fretibacter rubidus TaxID=570162 RepID=UPI00352A4BF5